MPGRRSWLGLEKGPLIRVYDGYGDQDDIIIQGHVLHSGPRPRRRYRENFIWNSLALLRLFMVKPYANARVSLAWNNNVHTATTGKDGYFRIEWRPKNPVEPGWHEVTVRLLGSDGKPTGIERTGRVFSPHANQFAIVSDIDDTFLISHSSNLRKRLYVLFTENAKTREPFEDVVDHYRALAIGTGELAEPNPFFYVSSSEWNLYDYIKTFCARHGLPDGILLLSQMKRLRDVYKTGQGKHSEKFVRIARIMRSYPHHRYILLGDDTQQDPTIYTSIVEHFPGQVHAVYIRKVRKANSENVKGLIETMEHTGVHCCYFSHSREAIEHSRRIGLIQGKTTEHQ